MTAEAASAPDLLFLGVCERAACVQDGNTNLIKWNVLGLKQVLLTYILPLPLRGVTLALALSTASDSSEYNVHMFDAQGKDIANLSLGTTVLTAEEVIANTPDSAAPIPHAPDDIWLPVFLPLPEDSPILIEEPGTYTLKLLRDDTEQTIGIVHVLGIDPPPLTADRISAIKSDPGSSKSVRIEVGCRFCPDKVRAYAGLERSKETEEDGWIWYEELPETYVCACGKNVVNLAYVRRNLHGLLGQLPIDWQNLSFVPLYEQGALSSIRESYARLLSSAKNEEELQKFFEKNPVLLHQFPAERLFKKPAVLTFFFADFAIVTPMRELILIELERVDTRLMRKDGGVAAPLSHAFDQVTDWLQIVDDHRAAVLDCLDIEKERVSSVRGVVIAGRDAGYDAKQLRKLKGVDRGRISLLTYDDILFSLDALLRRLGAM